jgi:hypothetical protein
MNKPLPTAIEEILKGSENDGERGCGAQFVRGFLEFLERRRLEYPDLPASQSRVRLAAQNLE